MPSPSAPADDPAADPSWRRNVRRRLLGWFAQHRRDLPWRRDRDPYRIWVSEIMLQQTQVATVVPYFERFVRAFPDLVSLAAAAEQDVLRVWEGLGYYRRARDLHRAARRLLAERGGQIPNDPDALRGLPGMGRYTVGAILSQAYDRRLPIVEANSRRVLCRLFGQPGDPGRGPVRRWLWEAAAGLLPARRVGDFNQALMELGAVVCTAAAPRCDVCPLSGLCAARRRGLQAVIPPRRAAPEIVTVREVGVVVRRGPYVLLVERPGQGRWARMWEFPHREVAKGDPLDDAVGHLVGVLTGLRAEPGPELLTVRHAVTRFRITLVCFTARYRSGRFRSPFYRQGKWVRPEDLQHYPISRPQRRLAQALLHPDSQRRLW
jgi:A/G-specific adenine glycosylase